MGPGPRSEAEAVAGRRAAERLLAQEPQILERLLERVRAQIAAARHEPHPILVDTLPAFLHSLAEALDPGHPKALATEGNSIALEHGGERARLTRYRPDDVIREYQLLRDVLLEVLADPEPVPDAVRRVVLESIDAAMAESCTAYFLVASRLREQFTAALTHDLRSPLMVIRANATLILRRTDKPEVVRWGSRIVDCVDRADQMLRDLLDASRVQAGQRLALQLSHADMVAIVHEAASHLAAIHGERFAVVAPESVPGHWAATEVRRAIENLGSNAVKYGSSEQPITLTVRTEHGRVLVLVHNHGSYVPAEDQEQIFQAFRRTEGAQRGPQRGWGIGLSIVRGVAEAHGGSVGIDSRPEAGTTFVIDLPLDARPYQNAPGTTSRG